MKVHVVGMWNDGSNPDLLNEKVLRAKRSALRVVQGGSATIRLEVITPAGLPVTIAGGEGADTLFLAVKRKPFDAAPLLKIAGVRVVAEGRNVCTFSVLPAQTKNLEFGRYIYDVWMTRTSTGERNQVVPVSAFVLSPGALPP